MSQALLELIDRFGRKRSQDERYEYHDPGQKLTAGEAADAVASLSDRQRSFIDETVIARLSDEVGSWLAADHKVRDHMTAKSSPFLAEIKKLDAAARGNVVVNWSIVSGLFQNLRHFTYNTTTAPFRVCLGAAVDQARKWTIELSLEQARAVIESNYDDSATTRLSNYRFHTLDIALDAIEAHSADWTFDDLDRAVFGQIIDAYSGFGSGNDARRRIAVLKEIIGGEDRVDVLWDGEPWATAVLESLRGMDRQRRKQWVAAISFAGTAAVSKPSAKWVKEARSLVAEIGDDAFESVLIGWLRGFTQSPRSEGPAQPQPYEEKAYQAWHRSLGQYGSNTGHLIGLVWLTHVNWRPGFAAALADVAEAVSRWPLEPRTQSANVAIAAARVLGLQDDDSTLAMLSRLDMRVRWPKVKKEVRKLLDETIKRRGLDRGDVEETVVPDFGLRDGVARFPFDGGSVQITLGKADKPTAVWTLDGGKVVRSLPASLKPRNPEIVEQVKRTVADIERMRGAQRTRLDLMQRRPRGWQFGPWRQRYLEHGLVGSIARRLIWVVDRTPVIWRDGSLVDVDGLPRTFADEAAVTMWHPASRPVDEVVRWRAALEQWEIGQPFKQAHREIYLLTDAERRTHTYSNRFAAHIVKAMTLLAISQVRQWKSGLYGGASSPSYDLPDHGLRAEWWVQGAGQATSRIGTPLYLATDQVRFVCTTAEAAARIGHTGGVRTPVPRELISPLVFSEILRDVDLFVGLASVGNDPNWSDGGPDSQFRDYWRQYAFGDLNESAKTRRAALERLVPRLQIRDRAELTDKFLRVRGNRRTYKIHLGSGNILMEPNDQYLCIVADSSAAPDRDLYLPFEGDSTLSIILSKAFMLAADDQIADPTITRQIGR